MMSHESSRWRRWKLPEILSFTLLLIRIQISVLGCQIDCSQVLTAPEGSFSSPCYPKEYPKNQACRWILQAPAGYVVQITFLDFELEEALRCIYDRVIVNTGSSNVSFCGITANGLSFNSTGNSMEVSFNSDFSVQKRGFNISYRQVAVALRNQKVTIPQNAGKGVRVASHVSIPALTQFSVCFEIARTSQKVDETIFTYGDQNTVILSLGLPSSTAPVLSVDGEDCSLGTILSGTDFPSTMTPFCLTWSSLLGRVGVHINRKYESVVCTSSTGKSVKGAGTLQLGGKTSFSGNIYNFRMWDYAMTPEELAALTCDVQGNVVDWENTFWDIEPAHIQSDRTLSCKLSYPVQSTSLPSTSTASISSSSTIEVAFYRITLNMIDNQGKMPEDMVQKRVQLSLNVTFENWPDSYINVSVQSRQTVDKRYTLQALLMTRYLNDAVKMDTEIVAKVLNNTQTLWNGLELTNVEVQSVENCEPEETPFHYEWPESKPTVTQFVPCFLNKAQNASRTCMISWQNYTSFWDRADVSNCIDIADIGVSPENAAEAASTLANVTHSNLSTQDVSKVVTKLKEIINVAKINTNLASTMVTIVSNVMTSSDTALATSSEMVLKTVEELVLKVEFDGPSFNITSKNLALGISSFNSSSFNGTSFSAYTHPDSDDLQIAFELQQQNSLAAVTLPSSLLDNLNFTEVDMVSRINFMFFNKTGLFQNGTASGLVLNSYVVASSVGNLTIKNLRHPVTIEIRHLEKGTNPVCAFWDFSSNNGSGGWNSTGCHKSNSSSADRTVCQCNHLTHFGILMDISRSSESVSEKDNKVLTFITNIGCGISAIFSAATLLTYIAFEKLRRDYPSKILMNLSTSLLFLNMVFLLDGWLASFEAEGLCISVAAFLHFFLLTTFTWMGLESVHMYIALVKVFNTYIRRYILKFCIVGWGLPAAIVAMVVSVDRYSYGKMYFGKREDGQDSPQFCWVKTQVVFYVTCVGYFSAIFLMNVAMFIVVMIQICGRNGKRSNRTLREEMLRNLRSAVSLTFLLGMTWGFAFFAWGPVTLAFMYLFSIFNSLQGLFIFIFHCALKENVQKQWRRYLCCGQFRVAVNSDWSKTPTNNTKKVSSDNFGKSLSSCSFGSSTANWTSKAKLTFNPFAKHNSNTGKCYSSQGNVKLGSPEADTSSILPVHQVIDKVKGYCSVRSDNFYKNIIMSDSFCHSTKF